MLIIGTAIALGLTLISILFIRSKYMKNNVKSRVFLYFIATLLVSSYIVYLALAAAGVKLL